MKTVKQSILADKTLRTLTDGTIWVGVDVHKVDYHAALWSEEGGSLRHWVQPADPRSLCKRLEPLAGKVAKVVYETTSPRCWITPRSQGPGGPGEVVPGKRGIARGQGARQKVPPYGDVMLVPG